MTIQIPDPGTGIPADKTGDNPWLAMTKVAENFSDQNNAASRLVGTANGQVPLVEQVPSLLGTAATKNVGTAAGNVMEVGAFGLGYKNGQGFNGTTLITPELIAMGIEGSHKLIRETPQGFLKKNDVTDGLVLGTALGAEEGAASGLSIYMMNGYSGTPPTYAYIKGGVALRPITELQHTFWTTQNATKDPNGFLKGASPIAEIHSDSMILNRDATEQGGITFEKLGVGDYLVKGSLGFAQEGWYIETPKDANGNVLVAVVYEQRANNDISIKTYAKKFDDETGDIVANLTKPRDIPDGRFISLRLHELPKEPPVMPMDEQTTEV